MITERDLLLDILNRTRAIMKSSNSFHILHQGGVLRGLVWAYVGDDPGSMDGPEEVAAKIGKKLTIDEGEPSFADK